MESDEQVRREKRQSFPGALPPTTKPPTDSVQFPSATLSPYRLSTAHRNSTVSVNRMASILEDENALFPNIQRRSRISSTGPYYRYGEDYITSWDLVGVSQSPYLPRAPSRNSTFSTAARSSGDPLDVEAGDDEKFTQAPAKTWVERRGGWCWVLAPLLLLLASIVGLAVGLVFGLRGR